MYATASLPGLHRYNSLSLHIKWLKIIIIIMLKVLVNVDHYCNLLKRSVCLLRIPSRWSSYSVASNEKMNNIDLKNTLTMYMYSAVR